MDFRVTLVPSGHSYVVGQGATVLDAGLQAGFNMPYSCRAGNCKTCRGTIVEGRVDHGGAHGSYLTDEQKALGFALLCKAKPETDLVIAVEELVFDQTKPKRMPCRVKRVRQAADDVAIVELRLPMNENLMFAAGQYIDFELPDGRRRSYSIATSPSSEGVIDLELHIRRMAGGAFTDQIFSTLKEGMLMRLSAPLGTFFVREKSVKPIILVATGTGFAPIKSIITYLIAKGSDRPLALYWGGRTKSDLYMSELVESWVGTGRLTHVPVLSRPSADDAWTGRTGYVQHAVLADHPDLSGFQVYACGSPTMVDSAAELFVQSGGLPESEFFADSFVTERDIARQQTA